MSKKNKKKFKKKFKAQVIQQMQSMQKESLQDKIEDKFDKDTAEESVSENKEKSRWNSPPEKDLSGVKAPVEIKSRTEDDLSHHLVKTDLVKVGWVLGLVIIFLTALTVINYQTTWLSSFSDAIAKFSHIVK